MMKRNRFLFFALFMLTPLLFSCSGNQVFSEQYTFNSEKWQAKQAVTFDIEIPKIDIPYNVFANISAKETFRTSNIWLVISAKAPSGAIQTDTVQFFLADASGKWLGKKRGSKIDCKFLYKRQIKFVETGVYKFQMQHAMRKNDEPILYSAGFTVEKATKNQP